MSVMNDELQGKDGGKKTYTLWYTSRASSVIIVIKRWDGVEIYKKLPVSRASLLLLTIHLTFQNSVASLYTYYRLFMLTPLLN